MSQFKCVFTAAVLLFSAICVTLQAQDEKDKANIRIDLAYHQRNNDLPVLMGSAKTKSGRRFEPVDSVTINLFFNEETQEGFIGRVTTNNKGIGSLQIPKRFKGSLESSSSYTFIATVTSDVRFEDASTEIEISKARIELNLESHDSTRIMTAKVLTEQDSGWAEVPETEMKFVVSRLLSNLNAGEEETYTTDENGEATSEFSLQIPGDMEGNILVGAKIEDNELYGNLITTKVVNWGLPMKADDSFVKRTLWSTRDKTPLWLLIFPNLIIASVWGVIFYLIHQIARIRKMGDLENYQSKQ